MGCTKCGLTEKRRVALTLFLDPEGRRYPYKKYVDGQWKISCAGLLAAYRRAITQGDTTMRDKAKQIAADSKCTWATGE